MKKKLSSYLKFWGTRGSTAVSGPEYIHFGGNTSCVEVRHGKDLLILDAGTGLRPLGKELKAKTIHLFIGHTHWDHIMGFPFFDPLYNSKVSVHIWTPEGLGKSAREVFTQMLSHPYFPIGVEDLRAKITFREIKEKETLKIGSIIVQSHAAFHPGSTLCFKITCGKTTFGYVSDNEFLKGNTRPPARLKPEKLYEPFISFFKGCDLLIHEAQYFPEEYRKKIGWGHSSITNASLLMKYAKIKQWIVTHHDPCHTDQVLEKKELTQKALLKQLHIPCSLEFAFDGMTYSLL